GLEGVDAVHPAWLVEAADVDAATGVLPVADRRLDSEEYALSRPRALGGVQTRADQEVAGLPLLHTLSPSWCSSSPAGLALTPGARVGASADCRVRATWELALPAMELSTSGARSACPNTCRPPCRHGPAVHP